MKKNTKNNTLYASNKNVDISSLITQQGGITGGAKVRAITKTSTNNIKKKINKKYKNDISEFGNDDGSDSDDYSDESESDEDDESNNKINIDKNNKDNEDDEDNEDDINEKDEDDDDKSYKSDKSGKSSIDEYENDGKEEKDYIDNEETLKSKCYSKYARVDYDELDFDELFGDDNLNPIIDVKLTKPILTKYEFVRLLCDRTKQLAQGAKPMLKNIEDLSSKEIAKLELKNKIIPLIIERPVPNSNAERWKLSELEIPEYLFTI